MYNTLKVVSSISLLLICTIGATSCNAQQHHMSDASKIEFRIIYENNTVGHIQFEKQILVNSYKTIETLELKTQFRGMKPLTTRIIETHEEDNQGHPLRFSKRIEIPNAAHQVDGEINGSLLNLRYIRGGKETRFQRTIPADFILSEGLRQKMKNSIQENQTLVFSEWDYDSQEFTTKKLTIVKEESSPYKWHTIQESAKNPNIKSGEQWLDQDFLPLKSSFNYLGKTMELVRCQDHCSDNTSSALRPLDQQMLSSPYLITDAALKGHIRYEIQMSNNRSPVETNEQKVRKKETAWILDVCAHCANYQTTDLITPNDYLSENAFMETNDKVLIAAVAKTIRVDDSPKKKMEKLSVFTRKRLEKNPQFAGYASALQAYERRTGDCTEYALLLATLGRIAKIPTRVVFGLSYSREYFHGRKNAFAPHAWAQAWIDGAWRSYDAALEVFDAGHIALSISDGNPQDFRAMFEDFNQLKIISAQQIVSKKTAD